ncbi:MAG: GDP-mannose 4,6-dehydratase, partial [Thermodesulfobacteriota bacterium]|nr:GDP-mannose 4,6-dehydratase [Thermodesulfobacteriota bacterium]
MSLRGRKVLVTGSCGFIGSHLVERLVELEARVRAFVYYNSFNRWGWLDILPDETVRQVEVITGDIRDFNCVRTAMDKVEVVFHLAALIGIPYSYIAPESYVDTNVKGTLNVLQAARDAV